MALDPNIILGVKPAEIKLDNPLDTASKVMQIRNLADLGKIREIDVANAQRDAGDQQALRDAYKNNSSVGPDGAPAVNRQGVLSDLAKVNPQLAQKQNMQFQQMDLDQLSKQQQVGKQLLFSINDQQSYDQAMQKAKQLGLPNIDHLPQQYDPSIVRKMQMQSLSAEEQLAQINKDRDFQLKQQENNAKIEENKIKREQLQGDKVDKMAKDMKNDLDADKGRAGNFGKISGKEQAAETLQTLVGSYKDGNLPPSQMEELALGMANMIGGGNVAARDQVKALVPSSAWGDVKKTTQWLLNEPMGADQQKFVEQMSHTVDREKNLATDQLNSIRAQRLSAHERFRQAAPDQYNNILKGYQFDQSRLKDGVYQRSSGGGSATPNFEHMSDDDVDALYSKMGGK